MHIHRNMVSEVNCNFWRVQIVLRIVNAVGGTLMPALFPSFVRNFEENCTFKVWEDADRQRPRGVECANFRAISVISKHSSSTRYSANLSSDYRAKFSAAKFHEMSRWRCWQLGLFQTAMGRLRNRDRSRQGRWLGPLCDFAISDGKRMSPDST